ncbi:MAG: hypothetical protein ABGZ35_01585 [Planctomycetaceae bacterium]
MRTVRTVDRNQYLQLAVDEQIRILAEPPPSQGLDAATLLTDNKLSVTGVTTGLKRFSKSRGWFRLAGAMNDGLWHFRRSHESA